MGRGEEEQTCSALREVCQGCKAFYHIILTDLTDSRKTCGRRSPKKCNYLGERQRPCTGKLEKSRWLNEQMCPSFTWQASKPQDLDRLVWDRKAERARRLLQARLCRPVWHTRTTTVFLRSLKPTPIPYHQHRRDCDDAVMIRLQAADHILEGCVPTPLDQCLPLQHFRECRYHLSWM